MDQNRITYGLPEEIENDILNGVPIEKLKRKLSEFPEYKSKSSQDLLKTLFTASTYLFAEKSAREMEKDFDFYKICPAEDDKTCSVCVSKSKYKYRFSDRVPGINFPPFHDGCRCTFTIEVEDWDKWMDDYEAKHSGGRKQKHNKKTDTVKTHILKFINIFKPTKKGC